MSGFFNTLKEIGVGAADFAEAAAGEVPVIGSITHGAEAVYNLGAAGIDAAYGDDKARHEHISNAALHGLEAIPVAGTGIGAYQITNDLLGGNTEEEMHDALYPEGTPRRELETAPKYEDSTVPVEDETKSTTFKVLDTMFGWM